MDRGIIPPIRSGVMANVAASANDPIFINHHTMIDCIFEEWLKRNLPTDLGNADNVYTAGNKRGHRFTDYIVPFFPLYRHQDMFKTSDNFGYTCANLPNISPAGSGNNPNSGSGTNNGPRPRPNMAKKHISSEWLLILSTIIAVAQHILSTYD